MQNDIKVSYTITCPSSFRDAVLDLAKRKKVNAGDIARSIILAIPFNVISGFDDPGEPAVDDREKIVLKSGPAKDRPWARKPRLQVRIPSGNYDIVFIRKALNLALALDRGDFSFTIEDKKRVKAENNKEKNALISSEKLKSIEEELEKMKAAIAMMSFEPLPNGVTCREEAMYVFGFPPFSHPDKRMIINRFRMLATIHHPDSELGSHERMSQLNSAMDIFRRSSVFH